MKERRDKLKEIKSKTEFVLNNLDKNLSYLQSKLSKNYHIFITDENFVIRKTTFKYDQNFSLAFAKDLFYKYKDKIQISLPICEPATTNFFTYAYKLVDNKEVQVGYILNSPKINKLKKELEKIKQKNPFIKDIKLYFIHPKRKYAQECNILNPLYRKYTLKEMIHTRKEGLKLYKKLLEKNPLITQNKMYILGKNPFDNSSFVIFELAINKNFFVYKIKKVILLSLAVFIIMIIIALIIYLEIIKILNYIEKFNKHIQKEQIFKEKIDNEIYKTVKAYNATLNKLQKLITSKEDFTHYAMHELATPINIISLYSEKYEELKPAVKKLLNSYKNLSFVTKQNYKKNIEKLNLKDILKDRTNYFKEIAEIENKNLILNIQNDLFIKANKEDIEMLIDNNIKNAINYSTSNNIYISLKDNILSFENEGEIRNKDKLFDKFYREDKIKGGFGLGLSIIKDISQKYNIDIKILQTKNNIIFKYIFKENNENSNN